MEPSEYIVDVDQTNVNQIIELSTRVPVLLDFWADWCEPCKTMAPVLEQLATDLAGRFVLAKVDIEANPMLCQQLGVRSVPALKLVVQGQLAGELDGAQPASVVRELLTPYLGEDMAEEEPVDEASDFLYQIQQARHRGAYDQAIEALKGAIEADPEQLSYQVLLAEVLMDSGDIPEAEAVLAAIADGEAKKGAENRLFFVKQLVDFETAEGENGTGESLQYRLAQNADDIEAKYYMAIHCVLAGETESAMEMLLDIVKRDRGFKEDGAREALLKMFDLVAGDPAVNHYRRKLFACLH